MIKINLDEETLEAIDQTDLFRSDKPLQGEADPCQVLTPKPFDSAVIADYDKAEGAPRYVLCGLKVCVSGVHENGWWKVWPCLLDIGEHPLIKDGKLWIKNPTFIKVPEPT